MRVVTSPDDWAAYFAIYEASLAHWGERASSRYEPALFEALSRRERPGVELWLAVLDVATIVAGVLCLCGPRPAAYGDAATLAEYSELRPENLLVHKPVLDARLRFLEYFDLSPSGGYAGVLTFNEFVGEGALPRPVIVYGETRAALVDRALRLARGRADGRA